MKRLAPFFFLIFLFTTAKAQRFKIGIRAGAAITDVDGFDSKDYDNDFKKFGLVCGGLVNTKIGLHSALQMEIDYTQKGSSFPPDSTNNNDYYRLALNYIDVSLAYRKQIHLNINKKPSDNFGFEIGASFGTLVESSYSVKSQPQPILLNTTDISLFIGIDYNITSNLYLCTRYSNSIIPAFPRNAFPSGIYALYYSSWNKGNSVMFQLTLGFIFGSASEIGNTPTSTGSDGN